MAEVCVCVCGGGGGGEGVGKRVNTVSSLISAGNYANTCNFTSKEVTVSILVSWNYDFFKKRVFNGNGKKQYLVFLSFVFILTR